MNKILYVIAQKDFRDEEYFVPKNIFEESSFEVVTTSVEVGEAVGVKGGSAKVDIALKDAFMDDYSAIVIAGGKGALSLEGNLDLERLIFDAMKADKVVAAICIAPLILARMGILARRCATVWDKDGEQAAILLKNGCLYFEESVVEDKNIITANGPDAAEEFARSIVSKF